MSHAVLQECLGHGTPLYRGRCQRCDVERIAELEAALATATDMAAIAIIEGMEREREACAKIADEKDDNGENIFPDGPCIAESIRARGSK